MLGLNEGRGRCVFDAEVALLYNLDLLAAI